MITGEGRVDEQTAFGKTALGVARRARRPACRASRRRRRRRPSGIEALARLGAVVVPVVEQPQSVEEAMAAGAAPVERCGERIARLASITGRRA